MKTIKLILKIYYKNILSCLFLFIIFTASIYFFSLALGQFRFITYTKKLYQSSGLQDSIYYMPSGFGSEISRYTLKEQQDILDSTFTKVQEFSGVQNIVKSPWVYNMLKLYDDTLIQAYPIELTAGEQLSSASNSDPTNHKGIDAIVGGYEFRNIQVGDTISVPLYDLKDHTILVHVIGKTTNNLYLPDFGVSSTEMDAQSLLQKQQSIVICRYTPELASYLDQYDVPMALPNFFVTINPHSTQEEKDQIFNYLSENGRTATYEDIIKNTNDTIAFTAKTVLPLPLFFLSISTFSLISISILFVYKNLKANSIYYLCGCNKLKGFGLVACAISGISIITGIIAGSIIGNINDMMSSGVLNLQGYRFDQMSIWFIVFYILAVLLLSVGIPYLIYRKMSPIGLYRRIQS